MKTKLEISKKEIEKIGFSSIDKSKKAFEKQYDKLMEKKLDEIKNLD